MATIVNTYIPICACCAGELENADTSGCEEYCQDGHVGRLCEFGLEQGEDIHVDCGQQDEFGEDECVHLGNFTCAGCGDIAYGGHYATIMTN